MAKIICTRRGAIGIHSLPKLKDGKPDMSTVQFFHVPGTAGLGRGGRPSDRPGVEIPDEILKELKAKDPFVRGLFASRELLEVDSFDPPAVEGEPATEGAPAWNGGIQGAEDGNSGKGSKGR